MSPLFPSGSARDIGRERLLRLARINPPASESYDCDRNNDVEFFHIV